MSYAKLGRRGTFFDIALRRFFIPLVWVWTSFSVYSQTTNYDFNLQVSSVVYTLALQPDGRILVGNIRPPFRLHTNGTLYPTFNPLPQEVCYTIGVQDDGKILLAGDFESIGGQGRTNLGRLNAGGSLDNPLATNVLQSGSSYFSDSSQPPKSFRLVS